MSGPAKFTECQLAKDANRYIHQDGTESSSVHFHFTVATCISTQSFDDFHCTTVEGINDKGDRFSVKFFTKTNGPEAAVVPKPQKNQVEATVWLHKQLRLFKENT